MSRFYGERRFTDYAITRRLSLFTALFLAAVSIVIIFVARDNLGNLFGTSDEAALEIAIATPVFLVGCSFMLTAGSAQVPFIQLSVNPYLTSAFKPNLSC